MKRNIVIGPPGTGKTTFLKDKVDKLINGGHCQPNEIGYFSFTVKAAEEIRDRVTKEEWSEAELKKMYPYFCTLHSLAYKRLQLQQSQDVSLLIKCVKVMVLTYLCQQRRVNTKTLLI